jgi:hypothetical protein
MGNDNSSAAGDWVPLSRAMLIDSAANRAMWRLCVDDRQGVDTPSGPETQRGTALAARIARWRGRQPVAHRDSR